MKISAVLTRHLHWVNLSGAVLIALLQRTPAVRVAVTAGEFVLASPLGAVLRSTVATIATLGAVHSLAGATTFVQSPPGTVSGTVGQTLSVGFTITGSPLPPTFFSIISGSLPPGLVTVPAQQSGIIPSGTPVITGIPTVAGTFNIIVRGSDGLFSEDDLITFVIDTGVAVAPQITTQPVAQTTVNAGATVMFSVVATGSPTPTFQWLKNGATIPAAIGSALTLPSVQTTDAATYSVVVTNAAGAATSSNAVLTVFNTSVAPNISTQPSNLVARVGQGITFSVVASGAPAPSYQWFKDGLAISNATTSSLTISSVKITDAANYQVIVTNSAGSVNSNAVTLTVFADLLPPVFTAQPESQTVATGHTVVFSAAANGAPTPNYQWRRNDTPIAGATSATLVVTKTVAADAGVYTCVATNAISAVTSSAATLTLSSTVNVGRLINLSILTSVTADDPFFTVGTVLGGGGAGVSKPLLVRAVGPSLVPIGVVGALPDPSLEMFVGSSSFAKNDNWGGDSGLVAVFAQLGAFAFVSPQAKDAAVFNGTTPAGSYTVQVSGVGGTTGTVIAELYDATPAAVFNASTPRLLDVSVLKRLAAGSQISAGFVIGGTTAKTVLVRAIGPGLSVVGVTSGFLADPHVTLFNAASVKIAENDNWGGDAQLRNAMTAVGAFELKDLASKDAVLLLTLSPGNYSAVADGLNNSAGFVIVEVYEVP